MLLNKDYPRNVHMAWICALLNNRSLFQFVSLIKQKIISNNGRQKQILLQIIKTSRMCRERKWNCHCITRKFPHSQCTNYGNCWPQLSSLCTWTCIMVTWMCISPTRNSPENPFHAIHYFPYYAENDSIISQVHYGTAFIGKFNNNAICPNL